MASKRPSPPETYKEPEGSLNIKNNRDLTPIKEASQHKLSNRQYEQLLRQNFINIRRVREWRDTHTQLLTVVAEHKWRINTQPATYEQLHLSMLAGLLGNVGYKLEDPASSAG